MSTRLLLEMAIRVLGLWFVFTGISSLASNFVLLTVLSSSVPLAPAQWLIWTAVPVVVQGVLGAALIWWAPWIASRFYPAGPEESPLHFNVGPGDVYRVACFVAGVCFLVHTAEPASRLVASLMQSGPSKRLSPQEVADSMATMVYAVAGVILVFGSRRIGELLSNLRYDPNTVPQQQFSLAILLVLVLLFALILGTIRWWTFGHL